MVSSVIINSMKSQFIKSLLVIAAIAIILIPVFPITAQGRPQSAILNVPYVMQAPHGDWSDNRQQYGCEEASIVMAMAWVRYNGDPTKHQIDKDEAVRDIVNMSEYEKVIYGFYEDTNAQDSARLIREFYQYPNVKVQENITVENIKQEIAKNRVVIVPLNTRATGLPMYKNGPVRHTIVVVGYDDKNDEVIIHDPIVPNGDFIWIPSSALQTALWNYNSGIHRPLGNRSTALISVGKPDDMMDMTFR